MFFCNTCCQPLCVACREETHRARMFARHEVVLLTKKAKDIQKECSKTTYCSIKSSILHLYIMKSIKNSDMANVPFC